MKSVRWQATAVALAVTLVACGGKDPQRTMATARAHLAQGQTDKALIEVKNALQAQPDLPAGRALLGRVLLQQENPAGAAIELRRALELGHDANETLPLLARALIDAGEAAKAGALEPEAKSLSRDGRTELLVLLAEANARVGDAGAARRVLDEALALSPEHVAARTLHAKAMASAGDLKGAAQVVDSVLATSPDASAAVLLKANLLAAEGNSQAAEAALRQLLQRQPRDLQAHAALISVLFERKAEPEVREAVKALNAVRAGHPLALHAEGRLAVMAGDLAQADDKAKQLLRAAPQNLQSIQFAAIVASLRGENEQAEHHYSRILAVAPGDTGSRVALARLALNRGDGERALEVLRPVLAAGKLPAAVQALVGEALMLRGQFQEADKALAIASGTPADATQVRVLRARLRLERGDQGALAELEDLAARDSSDAADLPLIAARVAKRDYDGALKALDRLDGKRKDTAVMKYLRGQLLVYKRDLAGARQAFEQAQAADRRHGGSLLALARLDEIEGKLPAARARLEAEIKARPTHSKAWLALASLAVKEGKSRSEVTELLQRAVRANVSDMSTRTALVRHLLDGREFEPALAAAQEATAALADHPDMVELLGAAQLSAGQNQQAARTFARLATLQPQSPSPLNGQSRALLQMGQLDQAIATARKALEINPDHLDSLRAAALALSAAGRHDDAVALIRSYGQRHTRSPDPDELVGEVERQRGRYAAAAVAFAAAHQKAPSTRLAILTHGSWLRAGDADRAARFAAQWQRAEPKDANFLVHLAAEAQDRGGDAGLTEAEGLLTRSIAIAPDNAPALNNLAYVKLLRKQPGAVELAVRAVKLSDSDPYFLDTLALALAREGKYERALTAQRRAVQIAPESPALRFSLAKILAQSGDTAAARQELEQLTKRGNLGAEMDAEVKQLRAKLNG